MLHSTWVQCIHVCLILCQSKIIMMSVFMMCSWVKNMLHKRNVHSNSFYYTAETRLTSKMEIGEPGMGSPLSHHHSYLRPYIGPKWTARYRELASYSVSYSHQIITWPQEICGERRHLHWHIHVGQKWCHITRPSPSCYLQMTSCILQPSWLHSLMALTWAEQTVLKYWRVVIIKAECIVHRHAQYTVIQ